MNHTKATGLVISVTLCSALAYAGQSEAKTGTFTLSEISPTVFVATYTGKIGSGFDYTGVFGQANTSLSGARYVAKYTYDLSQGVRDNTLPIRDTLSGGFENGGALPITATIVINGITHSFGSPPETTNGVTSGTLFEYVDSQPQYFFDSEVADQFPSSSGFYNNSISSYAFNANSSSLSTPIGTEILDNIGDLNIGTEYNTSNGGNYVPSVIASLSDMVPEPNTWIILLAGLSGVGATIRRSRRQLRVTSCWPLRSAIYVSPMPRPTAGDSRPSAFSL